MQIPPIEEMFADYYETNAVGHRIGLSMCYVCGATVILSDTDPWGHKRHHEWHVSLQTKE